MRRAALVATSLACAANAHASDPAPFHQQVVEGERNQAQQEPESARLAEYFPGLGTRSRVWSAESNTSFDTNRTFTQRFELARWICLTFPCDSSLFGVVLRASFGLEAALGTGLYSPQGPIPAIGIRDRSRTDSHWLEFGVRVIPSYKGPRDAELGMQKLALGATLSSGVSDDASWLPFSSWGCQLYGLFQTRADPWVTALGTLLFGIAAGGEASLTPMSVSTWLGPQRGFIGNAYIEGFVTVPYLGMVKTRDGKGHGRWHSNLQLGVHGEVSLSSIWPGNDSLPILYDFFVGWSPQPWFSMRVFGGQSGSPLAPPFDMEYGARLQFFVPDVGGAASPH